MPTQRIARKVFEAALGVPAAERQALVQQRCGDDEALRRQVESLLRHQDELGDFLAASPWGEGAPAGGEADEPWVGRTVGPYRLEALLGEGGMGRVYRAVREEPYRQEVAVKLLHAFAGEEERRRFDAERRVLAKLRHPRIARLLDGGATAEGTPYLVMELVCGLPLTTTATVSGCRWRDGWSCS